jgi:hypothetical protein
MILHAKADQAEVWMGLADKEYHLVALRGDGAITVKGWEEDQAVEFKAGMHLASEGAICVQGYVQFLALRGGP